MLNGKSQFVDSEPVEYRRIEGDFVSTVDVDGSTFIKVNPQALTLLAQTAFHDVSFWLRTGHLKQISAIANDQETSANDRFVANTLLRNATIAAKGQLPLCQDTGTAIVIAEKGERVLTGSNDYDAITKGIGLAYANNNLRYSQTIAQTMYIESNSGNNLPAQIDIHAVEGNEYNFLFMAKGGGSANKTILFQKTKALLTPGFLESFLAAKIYDIGTSACPPYHIAVVIGGTSAEENLRMVKLASAKCLEGLPHCGSADGQAFRDVELEQRLLLSTHKAGFGAQFGGKHFALDVRVIRLSRHGASCPVGIGVSCVADRNIRAKINAEGLWIEQLQKNPEQFVVTTVDNNSEQIEVDLNRPMTDILAQLSKYPVGTRLLLNGEIIVARDIAHARLKELLDSGKSLPQYFCDHPIYYAGPAKTPKGMASGSFGPTTAGRMDTYIMKFQKRGACLVTIAKGNRTNAARESCRMFGGFYLGSIGGAAAVLAHDCIKSVELVEFPELGMEAIYRIEVKNFPAFILIDNKGNEFYNMYFH